MEYTGSLTESISVKAKCFVQIYLFNIKLYHKVKLELANNIATYFLAINGMIKAILHDLLISALSIYILLNKFSIVYIN